MFNAEEKKQLLDNFDDEYHPLVALGNMFGPEVLDKLLAELGSQKVHMPTADNFYNGLFRQVRNKKMRNDFKGNNYDQLVIDYGLCERQVRQVVNGADKRYVRAPETNKPIKCPPKQHATISAAAAHYGVPMHAVLGVVLEVAMDLLAVTQALDDAFETGQLDMIA